MSISAFSGTVLAAGWVEGTSINGSLVNSRFWLPVVTNVSDGGTFEEGGSGGSYSGSVPNPKSYNNWNQKNYCGTAVDQNTENFVRLAQDIESNGFGLHILKQDSEVQEGVNAIQVVPNLIFNESNPMLATIVLPPDFSKSGSYPIILQGCAYGFNNNNLLTHEYSSWNPTPAMPPVFQVVVRSSKNSGPGAISVLLNCGGHEAFGIQAEAFESFWKVVDFIATNLGGDRNRVMCFGRSRGGLTALAWGSNPLGKDYKTIAIFAQAAFTEYGTTVAYAPSSMNGFPNGWNAIYGNSDALKNPAGHNPEDFIQRTTGYTSIEEANSNSALGLLQ